MVYKGSRVHVSDNTGILLVKILQIYGYREGVVGETMLTVVRHKKKAKESVKKKINNVFLISRRRVIFRARGFYYVKLLRNTSIVLSADPEKFLGTRHFGFLTLESKIKAFTQLLRTTRVLI
jgi:ribosomal protein L14